MMSEKITTLQDVKELTEKLKNNVKKIIKGKDETIEIIIAAMYAGGHILLEDVPGSGKTTMAKTLAKSIDGDFKRIQMTPDFLPSDVTGINFFDMKQSDFRFVKGPVFSNILIVDEINRATPKTQAGLLEAMEEGQVTVDGKTYELMNPFLVIATENPIDTQGVFPLPEAQIDRFCVKLSMSYPSHEDTIDIMKTHMSGGTVEEVEAVAAKEDILAARELVSKVNISDELIEYVVNILEATRESDRVLLGASQRGGLALIGLAKSMAAIDGRSYVLPDDIKRAAPYVLCHRLILKTSERIKKDGAREIIEQILKNITVPAEWEE